MFAVGHVESNAPGRPARYREFFRQVGPDDRLNAAILGHQIPLAPSEISAVVHAIQHCLPRHRAIGIQKIQRVGIADHLVGRVTGNPFALLVPNRDASG